MTHSLKTILLATAFGGMGLFAGDAQAANSIVYGAANAGLAANATTIPTGQQVTVTGPLLQVTLDNGTEISLHNGATFILEEGPNGPVLTLLSGNVRVTNAAVQSGLTLRGQGGSTIAMSQGSSASMTAQQDGLISGRVFTGEVVASAGSDQQSFKPGNGFTVTADSVSGTFTPVASQSPAYMLSQIVTAAGGSSTSSGGTSGTGGTGTPPQNGGQPTFIAGGLGALQLAANTTRTSSPNTTNPDPTDPDPVDPDPVDPTDPDPVDPTDPTDPDPTDPDPTDPTDPTDPDPTDPTDPDPVDPGPTTGTIDLDNLQANYTPILTGIFGINNGGTADSFSFTDDGDGNLQLEAVRSSYASNHYAINRGTAAHADAASAGQVAGIGRWVGGEIDATVDYDFLPGETFDVAMWDYKGNLHYAWGQPTTTIPTTGDVTYSLHSSTSPTYYGAAAATDIASSTFDGTMRIDFGGSGYGMPMVHTNGVVAMNHTDGTTTNYTFKTPSTGNGWSYISGYSISSGVKVSGDGADPLGCANACNMRHNLAMYGEGAQYVGDIYVIKTTSGTNGGIEGAALFQK